MKRDVTNMTIIQEKGRDIFEELKKQTSLLSYQERENSMLPLDGLQSEEIWH